MTDIVYLTVDSLRADHVSWHGYERETMPFLSSLNEDAHTFTNAFTNGCFTRQAFPSMMTSVYPSVARDGGGLDEDYVTIAQALSQIGYNTAGFHSNPYLGSTFGYDKGFGTFYDSKTESDKGLLERTRLWIRESIPKNSIVYRTLETMFAQAQQKAGVDLGTPSIPADKITNQAIDWVSSVDNGPRFLWVHYMDVHHPYTPPEKHQLVFRDNPVSKRRAIKLQRKMLDEPQNITQDEFETLIDLYDSEIRFFDAQAKRLIEAVRTHWGSDVVIAFTSDHGEEFRDHDGFSHSGTLYDELLHIPLFLFDNSSGGIHGEVVSLLDIPPTFIGYANGTAPETFQGESLKPLIGDGTRERTYAIADHAKTIAYRDQTWKYITGPERNELYNIEQDPDEQTDVNSEYPDIIQDIEAKLAQHSSLGKQAESDVDVDELDDDVQDRLEQLGYLQE